jgi:hypothetical protein
MDDGLGTLVHPQAVAVLGLTTSQSAIWFAGRVLSSRRTSERCHIALF